MNAAADRAAAAASGQATAPLDVRALVGPTASGKTAVALQAAEHLDAEIVAVDAFTVYRGMDVGTAKPTAEERGWVAHHLVDVLSPHQECTVEWFQSTARAAVADVAARGRIPLLVGGSGLYFRAVVDHLEFPPTDATVRARVESEFAGDPAAAHAALAAVDPDAAERIDPENLRRSVRALEVHRLTGRRFSDWHTAWEDYTSVYPQLRVVGLDVSRAVLDERIAARVDAMLSAGLVDECRQLAQATLSTTARQAIGYAEIFDHLEGRCTIDEAAAAIRSRTRRYAVRQERWFRRDPRVRWAAPSIACEVLTG